MSEIEKDKYFDEINQQNLEEFEYYA